MSPLQTYCNHPFSVAIHSIYLLWSAQLEITILIPYRSTMPIGLTFHQPQPSFLSSPLSPPLPPPPPPSSLLSSPLLLLPLQFPPLPKLIVVCACHCHCPHSNCHRYHRCRCSRSRCCRHHRCHRRCRRCSCRPPLHGCLTTTLQLSIATTIECSFHPPLPLLLPSIATVKCQCTQLSIAAIVSLVASHFLCQSSKAALRWYRCQPTPAVAVPVNGWLLLFVCWIAPHLIHLLPLCDHRCSCCPSPLPYLSPPTLVAVAIVLFIAIAITRPPPLMPSRSPS